MNLSDSRASVESLLPYRALSHFTLHSHVLFMEMTVIFAPITGPSAQLRMSTTTSTSSATAIESGPQTNLIRTIKEALKSDVPNGIDILVKDIVTAHSTKVTDRWRLLILLGKLYLMLTSEGCLVKHTAAEVVNKCIKQLPDHNQLEQDSSRTRNLFREPADVQFWEELMQSNEGCITSLSLLKKLSSCDKKLLVHFNGNRQTQREQLWSRIYNEQWETTTLESHVNDILQKKGEVSNIWENTRVEQLALS